jgi:hypothetical protein
MIFMIKVVKSKKRGRFYETKPTTRQKWIMLKEPKTGERCISEQCQKNLRQERGDSCE